MHQDLCGPDSTQAAATKTPVSLSECLRYPSQRIWGQASRTFGFAKSVSGSLGCGSGSGSARARPPGLRKGRTLTAQLLNGGPLLRLLPRLGELLISGPHGLQQQADTVLQEPKTKAPTCFAMVVTLSLISFSSRNIKTQFRDNYKISQAVTMKHKTPHAEVYKIKC